MVEHHTLNTVVHAAVRRDLERLERALADFPVGSRARAEQVDAAWRFLDGQLTHHHHGEETIFWPALGTSAVDPALIAELDAEHEAMADAMGRTRTAMSALAADPGPDQLADARTAVSQLRTSIETHFAHEERDLEPISAAAVGTPAFKKAETAVRKTQSLSSGAAFLTWLLDDADPGARAQIESQVPKPVLFVLTRLSRRSYRKVALSSVDRRVDR